MWWNAFSIFLLVSFATVIHAQAKWDPLHLFVVCKRGLLKPDVQDRLQGAMKWFEQAVQVERTVLDSQIIGLMKKQIPPYTGLLTITAPDKVFSIAHDSPELEKLWKYATPIFLDYDAAQCASKTLLASAQAITTSSDDRPFAMNMFYCPENANLNVDTFDIFRHEVLHGLGYAGNTKTGLGESETYDWVDEDGSKQTATRRFVNLDGNPEIQAIRDHFGCQDTSVKIRAESDLTHHHLNQYIFGNEMMTPSASATSRSIFSYITAEILEKSFNGDDPWYKVNRTFIAAEAETYTYGKGLGCDFLLKSCWELFKAKQSSIPFMYPFCRGSSMDAKGKFCYNDETGRHVAKCNKNAMFTAGTNSVLGQKSDEGIVKKPNADNKKHNLKNYRFCPMAARDYNKVTIVPCGSG